jgi:hypothetical protein
MGSVFFLAKWLILVNMPPNKSSFLNLLSDMQYGINIKVTAKRRQKQDVLAERDI